MAKRKNPGGRKKIEIKRITREQARQVCFSKRRMGLFKKACELCILCGAEVAIVVYSPAGRPFSLGGPDVGMVADRFLSGPAGQPSVSHPTGHCPPAHLRAARWRVREDPSELQRALAAEKRGRAALEQALGDARGAAADVKDMRLHELEEMETALLGLRAEVAVWASEILFEVDVDGCWNGAAPADAVVAGGYPDTVGVGVGDGAGNRAPRLVFRYPVPQ